MAAEAAQRQREDGGVDAGLEEEDEGEGGDAAVAGDAHGAADEEDDHAHEEPEDVSRLQVAHAEGGEEAADGEEGLRDGEEVGGCGLGCAGADLWKRSVREVASTVRTV